MRLRNQQCCPYHSNRVSFVLRWALAPSDNIGSEADQQGISANPSSKWSLEMPSGGLRNEQNSDGHRGRKEVHRGRSLTASTPLGKWPQIPPGKMRLTTLPPVGRFETYLIE